MENKRKQKIKEYYCILNNEKDYVKCKTRLDNLSERDLKRVNRYSSSPTYYGDKVLTKLLGESNIGVIKHLQHNTLNYIKERQDYVHGVVDNLNGMIADPKSFDCEKYERLKESLTRGGDNIDSLFFSLNTTYPRLKWCITCNSEPKLISTQIPGIPCPDCNGSFCSGGNCANCKSYVQKEYSCKCTSEQL